MEKYEVTFQYGILPTSRTIIVRAVSPNTATKSALSKLKHIAPAIDFKVTGTSRLA